MEDFLQKHGIHLAFDQSREKDTLKKNLEKGKNSLFKEKLSSEAEKADDWENLTKDKENSHERNK